MSWREHDSDIYRLGFEAGIRAGYEAALKIVVVAKPDDFEDRDYQPPQRTVEQPRRPGPYRKLSAI